MNWIEIGGGLTALAALVWLVWFAYRAGQDRADVSTSRAATDDAQAITRRAEAMAQAQADKPGTTGALLERLDRGDA